MRGGGRKGPIIHTIEDSQVFGSGPTTILAQRSSLFRNSKAANTALRDERTPMG